MSSHSSFHTLKWRKGLSQENMPFYLLITALSSLLRLPQQHGSDACAVLELDDSASGAAPKNSPDKCPILMLFSSLPLQEVLYHT